MRRLSVPLLAVLLVGAPLPAQTVLVIPFFNLNRPKSPDWIGESLAEAIQDALAGEALMLVNRDTRDDTFRRLSVRRYAPLTRGSVMELALNLDAGEAVSGDYKVQPGTPDSLQVDVRITDVKRLKKGAEFNESGPLDELSQIQARIAWRVLGELMPTKAGTLAAFLQSHPTVRLDALEQYIRGLMTSNVEQKLKFFSTAVRLENGFAAPSYQLARLYYDRRSYRSAAEWYKKIPPADPHYRESQFYMGISLFETGDYLGAEESFLKVAQAMPLGEVLNNLGAAQLRQGNLGALDTLDRAVETDPQDPVYLFNSGYALWRLGRFDDAAARLRSALERDPTDESATMLLGRCLQRSGPRPGDLKTESLEILKTQYNESAWLQLKALVR